MSNEFLVFCIIIVVAILIGLVIGLSIRKLVFGRFDKLADELMKKKGTTLEKELQGSLLANKSELEVVSAKPVYMFKYNDKTCNCIVVKLKVNGMKDWFTGVVSDSGSCTEFQKYHPVKYYEDGIRLFAKMYKMPNMTPDADFIGGLPEIPNVYKRNLRADEYVVYNCIVKNFKTDGNISIGLKAKLTITTKNIYVYNGVGLWCINLYNDIYSYKKTNECVEIYLSEVCEFGQNGERLCTGYKLFFSNDEDMAGFDALMSNIYRKG